MSKSTSMTEKVVGLWLDETSNTDESTWIVSIDAMSPDGEAESTTTVECHEDYEDALGAALELARKRGLCVIRTGGAPDHRQECVYAPKLIKMRDGMGHLAMRLTLSGGRLHGDEWMLEILETNGIDVDDEMTDDCIAGAVYDAYSGDGYEGDPEENGLTVEVTDVVPVIARRA